MSNLKNKLHGLDKSSIRILLVDDCDLTLAAIRLVLKNMGYPNIQLAENNREAWEIIQKGMINLIICDWNMPEGSGLELLKQVRGDRFAQDTVFVFATAKSDQDTVVSAIKMGASDFIVKPITQAVLEAKFTKIFGEGD